MRYLDLGRGVRFGLPVLAVLMMASRCGWAQSAVRTAGVPRLPAGAVDAGALPGSQPVQFTVYLAGKPDQQASLDTLVDTVVQPGSSSYHQWLTPAAFADQFGPSEDALQMVQTWAAAAGFNEGGLSKNGTRLQFSGTVAQVEAAFAPGLHTVQLAGIQYRVNTAVPQLPASISASVLAIKGLSTLPAAATATVRTAGAATSVDDLLAAVDAAVEANTSPVLTINSAVCAADVDTGTQEAMHLLLKEAAVQGITVLASSGCAAGASFPGSLAEALSAASPAGSNATVPLNTELRPDWQFAPGLPADGLRHEPDFLVSSLPDLQAAVLSILSKQAVPADGSQARLGNIARELYELAPQGDIFTQTDATAAGTWEVTTGLGTANLAAMVKHFPDASSITPQVSISPTYGSFTHGGSTSFTITASDPTNAGIPAGTVSISVSGTGGTYATQVTLNNGGSGSFSTTALGTLPGGNYTVTASYPGQGAYGPAQGTATLSVQSEALTLTPTVASTVTVGDTFTFTVQVAAPSLSGSPHGTLTLTGTGIQGTAPFTSNGNGVATATAQLTATQAGQLTIYIACTTNSDPSFTCQGQQFQLSVVKATPGLSISVAPNPPTYGNATTISVTFTTPSGTAPQPTGNVTFTDSAGGTIQSQYTASGSFSFQVTTLSGTVNHTITATYAGDANYNSATGSTMTTGTKVSTTVSVTAAKSAVVTGGTVQLTAVLAPATALTGLTPTGTVTFYSNGVQLGAPQAVPNYTTTVTFTPTFATQGSNTITATYSGDTNYSGSTTTTATSASLLVGPATSDTITAAPTGNVVYGTPISFTATVKGTPTDGSGALAGTITFNISGTDHQTPTATLTPVAGSSTSATATASLTGALDVGTYTVTLTCSGANFDCSNLATSGSYPFMVTKAPTTTQLVISPTNPTPLSTVGVTVTVAPTTAITGYLGTITGSVIVQDNGVAAGTFPVTNGTASGSVTLTSATGADSLVAYYSGDANNVDSHSAAGVTVVTPVGTGTTITASRTTALVGANIVFTATVSATPTSSSTTIAQPTGTVYFYDNISNGQQVPLGTGTLVATGPYSAVAYLNTKGLIAGTHNVSASFTGTNGYTGSATTGSVTIQIQDYTLAFTANTFSLKAGQAGTSIAQISAVNGFSGQVVLGCTAPAGTGITCSFNTQVIQAAGFSQLTVQTTAARASVVGPGREWGAGGAGAVLACLLLPIVRRRSRIMQSLLAAAALAVLSFAGGCTNINNGPSLSSGVGSGSTPGTQFITISTTGTDGITTVQHNQQLQVTVTQ